jgi:hypothetical protein
MGLAAIVVKYDRVQDRPFDLQLRSGGTRHFVSMVELISQVAGQNKEKTSWVPLVQQTYRGKTCDLISCAIIDQCGG